MIESDLICPGLEQPDCSSLVNLDSKLFLIPIRYQYSNGFPVGSFESHTLHIYLIITPTSIGGNESPFASSDSDCKSVILDFDDRDGHDDCMTICEYIILTHTELSNVRHFEHIRSHR